MTVASEKTRTTTLAIDADAHVVETERTWDYMDASEEKFKPQVVESKSDGRRYWMVDGQVSALRIPTISDADFARAEASSRRNFAVDPSARRMEDIDLRLRHMTELGIDVQVLHNTLWLEQLTDRPDVELALVRSWNRWLADIWRQGDGRLLWTCLVPFRAMDEVRSEVLFCRDHGAVGICVRPFEADTMMLDPLYYPLYELAQELDMPVIVHIANGSPSLMRAIKTRYSFGDGTSSFRFPTVLACYDLLRSGVPREFPNLRWGFIETSAQWIPWVVNEVARRVGEDYTPERNPFRDHHIYVNAQTDDDVEYISRYIGDDNLVIGTDYGHTDPASETDAITKFRGMDLRTELLQKLISDNPARLYGIKDIVQAT